MAGEVDRLTAFEPFESEKTSKLPFKGHTKPGPKEKPVEISETLGIGPPKVFFRKFLAPTPAPTPPHHGNTAAPSRARTSPVQGSVRPPLLTDKEGSSVGLSHVEASSRANGQPTASQSLAMQLKLPRVSKSVVLNRIGNLERQQVCECVVSEENPDSVGVSRHAGFGTFYKRYSAGNWIF